MALHKDFEPGDPCGCSSGLSYGECHKPIFDAPANEMVAIAQRLYAEAWETNATGYRAQGIYQLLAEQLAGCGGIARVLDIGCGRGHGLEALRSVLPRQARFIGVDENADCLEGAAELLGVDALPGNIRRMSYAELPNGHQLARYSDGPIVDQRPLTLVQSDVIMRDAEFERLLGVAGALDAVTLWFSGVHKARSATELARHFEIKSDADHRALVEDRALDIAGERLRVGGLLHLVARVAANDMEAVAHETARTYAEWLQGTPFALETVGAIPYTEPDDGIRVRSPDARVTTMPSYAISMLVRRSG